MIYIYIKKNPIQYYTVLSFIIYCVMDLSVTVKGLILPDIGLAHGPSVVYFVRFVFIYNNIKLTLHYTTHY